MRKYFCEKLILSLLLYPTRRGACAFNIADTELFHLILSAKSINTFLSLSSFHLLMEFIAVKFFGNFFSTIFCKKLKINNRWTQLFELLLIVCVFTWCEHFLPWKSLRKIKKTLLACCLDTEFKKHNCMINGNLYWAIIILRGVLMNSSKQLFLNYYLD